MPRRRLIDSPTAAGAGTLIALLLWFWVSGVLFPSEIPRLWSSRLQLTGMGLTYATITAFLVWVLRYYPVPRGDLVRELVDSATLVPRDCREELARLQRTPKYLSTAATIGGLLCSLFNIHPGVLRAIFSFEVGFANLSLALGSVVLWIVVVQTAVRGINTSRILYRLGAQFARVDLYQLDRLLPFAKFGTFSFMVVAVALGLTALQALDAEFRAGNFVFALAFGIPVGAANLLLPLVGIRRSVRCKKQQTLAELDAAIGVANRDLEVGPVEHLDHLVSLRNHVARAREWPLNTTALSRVGLYIVIPPFAWTGAALIEIALTRMLGSN